MALLEYKTHLLGVIPFTAPSHVVVLAHDEIQHGPQVKQTVTVTRAVLGVAARHGVVELGGPSGEQDVKDEEVVGLEVCCVFSC